MVDGVVVPDEPGPQHDGAFGPMGGLWSTVGDLARWVQFWLDAFPARDDLDDAPLRRSSRREAQRLHRAGSPVHVVDPDGAARVRTGGYGMGLLRLHDPLLGDVVTHSGGLPGYCSNMRWRPDRGIGAVALANVTYAPMAVTTRSLLATIDARSRPARSPLPRPPAAAPVAEAAAALVALLGAWHDASAEALFADNVALDESFDRRRAAAVSLVDRIGAPSVESLDADTGAAAHVLVGGERGRARLELQLSPLRPPKVQWYEVTVVPALDPVTLALHDQLRAIAGDLDAAPLAGLLAPTADLALLRRRLLTVGAAFGPFTGAEAVGGDEATPVVRWAGAQGDVDVAATIEDGQVTDVHLTPVD